MSADLIKALSAYASCDIADALTKLGDPYGGFIPGITLQSPRDQDDTIKVIGPAYTAAFKYLTDLDESKPRITQHFVDTAPPGSVIFISCPEGMLNAVWGGITSVTAQRRGIAGTIVDGLARDIQEIRQAGYPVFARGLSTTTPVPLAYMSEVNEPVTFKSDGRELTINPGDLLIADANGVICVPLDLAEKALELVKSIASIEQLIAEEIEGGKSFTEASKHRSKVGRAEST